MQEGEVDGRQGGIGREKGGPEDEGDGVGCVQAGEAEVPAFDVGRGGGKGMGVPYGWVGGSGKQEEEEREEEGRHHFGVGTCLAVLCCRWVAWVGVVCGG